MRHTVELCLLSLSAVLFLLAAGPTSHPRDVALSSATISIVGDLRDGSPPDLNDLPWGPLGDPNGLRFGPLGDPHGLQARVSVSV